ncbi:alpha/beta hydrolase family protein [Snuella sedimenti]|uniref:Alpha/beta fold hydrolase n=1 Tax=Snuella sedimenti TaxID=2798802 RepID=A0A8J7LT75_9FLAO|nr:alpha/beta fold hydrolase [Snuella sedimenti]MBJ6368001.1 alpha/beta fold hydrolase [Snuella sedimenti]
METIDIVCKDSFVIKGNLFLANAKCKKDKVVIINSATGISRNLYKNYATYLAENGFDSLTYDYRGIAESRPKKLRGFKATFTTWGQNDFTSVLKYVKEKFPQHKILVLGHSIGGTIIGMSENCNSISGILNIGAQTSYYKDWSKQKYKLYFLWHIVFPLVTNLYGYFPGKKLKLLEDIPKGVIKQWDSRKKNPDMVNQLEKQGHKLFYNQYKGKLLTLAIEDDVIGTKKALKRVYTLFTSANKEIENIKPNDVGVSAIGHFGFFSRKYETTLWRKSIEWYKKI